MDIEATAAELLDAATADQQVVRRLEADAPVPELRAAVRRLARARGVRIRTAMLGDALAVVRADADVWHEPVATMRAKLTPDDGR